MNFKQSEEKIQSISQSLKEWKGNPSANLLQDKLKKEIIELYDYVSTRETEISIKEEILMQPTVAKVETKKVEEVQLEAEAKVGKEPLAVEVIEVKSHTHEIELEEKEVVKVKKIEKYDDPFDLFNGLLTPDDIEDFKVKNHKNTIQSNNIDVEIKASPETELKEEEVLVTQIEETTIVEKLRVPLHDKLEEFKTKPIFSLNNSIPIGKKFEFIEDLFIGNSDEYNRAISEINVMSNYKQAEEFLMVNYFDKYGWMEKEKVLNNLFDFITRRFTDSIIIG